MRELDEDLGWREVQNEPELGHPLVDTDGLCKFCRNECDTTDGSGPCCTSCKSHAKPINTTWPQWWAKFRADQRAAMVAKAELPMLEWPPMPGDSWQQVDLAGVIAGLQSGTITRPTPTVGRRGDGAGLFYEGRINSIFGDNGAGKSMTGHAISAGEILAGRHVIWIDYEDDETGTCSRLLDLGLRPDLIVEQFHYFRPEELFDVTAENRLAALIDTHDVALVVIDSTGEAMGLEGKKVNDDLDNAQWMRRFPRFVANLGPAVLLIDHVVKNKENRGLDPAGSYRKKASITGTALIAEMLVEFGIGRSGRSRLTCAKDRAGNWVRGQRVAEFVLDATTIPYQYSLDPPESSVDETGQFRPTVLMEKVSRWLELNPGASKNQIETAHLGKAEYVRQALDILVRDGFVAAEKQGQALRHTAEKPYREDME